MSDEVTTMNPDGSLAVCIRKKNDKKPVTFYKDRMDFMGETILYSDIESVRCNYDWTRYQFIFETYSAYIRFRLKDGTKKAWRVNSGGLFGIHKIKQKREYFHQFFEAFLATGVKTVAAGIIARLKQGETIKIGNLTLDANGITAKSGLKTQTHSYAEMGEVDISWSALSSVNIRQPGGQRAMFNGTPVSQDNALCLMFIVPSMGASAAPAAPAPEA